MVEERSIELNVGVAEGDDEDLERLTRQLRRQLEELDVEGVEPIKGGPAPDGTKAVDVVMIGGLVVRFGPAVLSAVARAIQAWVGRDAHRSVKIRCGDREIALTAASAKQQEELVEQFLAADEC